jgi:hypothetical protein
MSKRMTKVRRTSEIFFELRVGWTFGIGNGWCVSGISFSLGINFITFLNNFIVLSQENTLIE